MIRIGRLTDYGIVLMSHLAAHGERVYTAGEVATEAHLPLPTVSKLLRRLARRGLLASHRGVKGGYGLALRPEAISIGSIIAALEGPVSMTTCTNDSPGECGHEPLCPVSNHWHSINSAIRQALDGMTLADLAAHPRGLPSPLLAACPPSRRERCAAAAE